MTIKHLSATVLSIFFTLAPNALHAEEKTAVKPIQAKLVAISASVSLKNEDEELQRIFNYSSSPALRLTYLVKEKNIVEIIEKSVITKDSEGWKCGSFPRVSEAGDAATFNIEKEGEFLAKLNETKLDGTIDILVGSELIPKSFSLLAYDEPFRMDDFVFTLLEDKLKVDGNHKLIKEMTVEYNGKIIETRGSSWSDATRTYNYEGIGKGVKITFSYWDGLVTKKVQFTK